MTDKFDENKVTEEKEIEESELENVAGGVLMGRSCARCGTYFMASLGTKSTLCPQCARS